jgi:hypothetical protein
MSSETKKGLSINIILVVQRTINKSKKNKRKPAELVSNPPLLSPSGEIKRSNYPRH